MQSYALKEWWRFIHSFKSSSQNTIKAKFVGGVLGVWGHGVFSKIKISYGKTFPARRQSYGMKELWRLSHSVKSYSQNTIKTIFWGCFRGMGSWGFFKNKNLLWQNIPRTLAIICHDGMLKIHSFVQKLQPKNHKNKFFWGCFTGRGSWVFFKNKNLIWQNIPLTWAIICYEGMVKIHWLVQKLQPKNKKKMGVFQK